MLLTMKEHVSMGLSRGSPTNSFSLILAIAPGKKPQSAILRNLAFAMSDGVGASLRCNWPRQGSSDLWVPKCSGGLVALVVEMLIEPGLLLPMSHCLS